MRITIWPPWQHHQLYFSSRIYELDTNPINFSGNKFSEQTANLLDFISIITMTHVQRACIYIALAQHGYSCYGTHFTAMKVSAQGRNVWK